MLIFKYVRRFSGFDDKIVAIFARGMTMREIQGFLNEQYGTEVSPQFISLVADEVMAKVTARQSRPLEPMYQVAFFMALRVKIRDYDVVRNKAIYRGLGVLPDGSRDIRGLWIEGTEVSFASWKDRRELAKALRPIYTAPTAELDTAELGAFEASDWGQRFPTVVAAGMGPRHPLLCLRA